MKKFRFRLQRVLDYRKLVKDERKRELLLANHKLRQVQKSLEDLQSAEQANLLQQEQVISAAQVYLKERFAERLQAMIVAQRLALIEAEKLLDQARDAYIEAAKDAQALETLRERKLEEYKQYLLAEDQKFLDELATQKGNTFEGKNHV
ncbi:MAG: flagellar export protein FliJ [Bdellovibrionales bacterium]|nr:flagellar export protein FliJ [Bdellovibrionales bacterium]